jgi:hypothetical protein
MTYKDRKGFNEALEKISKRFGLKMPEGIEEDIDRVFNGEDELKILEEKQ